MEPRIFGRDEQHCAVCGQPLDDEAQANEGREISLFGAGVYAWCPTCGRQVKEPWDAAYKVRWSKAFSDWCRSQQARERRQPKPTTIRMVSAAGSALDLVLTPREAHYELQWMRDGQLQMAESFASRESAGMRMQELMRALRAQGYRCDGAPKEPERKAIDMRPADVWMLTLRDGRQARATMIPTRSAITLALFIDDVVQELEDFKDVEAALRRATDWQAAVETTRRRS